MGFLDTFLSLLSDVGMGNPLSRAISLGCIGFGLQYFVRPSISYTNISSKNGGKSVPKEFALTSKASPTMTTWFPWYMWPTSFAIIGGLFI
jgi:hypothetical protein